ncbi:single-stranded DNA-binding protein [Macrococcus brunensis]|uniref:single-stranded DNA-binding protein n=1 Tax=Macrococcus brunensis TaxID=198483 RepID=UPI001EF12A09|nr:single-stranded DNA-binding protein [Macrococcus brunensis]ULG72998.1 single-stranded DNA-binding protein [Macrococcus brunensis]
MINRVVLVGRLTKDPEYRVTPSGVSVATFTLAVNRTFTNVQGERQADFINCIVFRKQAEAVNTYLSKGSLAGIDGRLQSRSYDNQEGQKVYVTEVVCDSVQFLEPKGSGNNARNGIKGTKTQNQGNHSQNQNNVSQGQNTANNNPFSNAPMPDIDSENFPF